jgi:hypothetical protein
MNSFRFGLPIVLLASLVAVAPAAPAEIIFLRHAEKPPSGSELNAQGWKRAQALAGLFTQDVRAQEHGRPVAIYSGGPVKPGGSIRSIQTMIATGQALQLPVDSHIDRDNIAGLVQALLDSPAYEGKTVLVCWEHKKIPKILEALGWAGAPKKWNEAVYDRLWILNFEHGRPVRFRDLPEKLLPGDSTQ